VSGRKYGITGAPQAGNHPLSHSSFTAQRRETWRSLLADYPDDNVRGLDHVAVIRAVPNRWCLFKVRYGTDVK